ncbi:MAG: hypothetical protein M3P18_10055 [Actinomycetota bacterium]|nr:hypothetical protein [Actinomycetota bacterium]
MKRSLETLQEGELGLCGCEIRLFLPTTTVGRDNHKEISSPKRTGKRR